MKMVWSFVNSFKLKKDIKNFYFITMMMLISAIVGGVIWQACFSNLLKDMVWFVCFMGYPAVVFGMFGSVIYLYNYEFK